MSFARARTIRACRSSEYKPKVSTRREFLDIAKESGFNAKTIYVASTRINFCLKPPAAASPSTTTTTTAARHFSRQRWRLEGSPRPGTHIPPLQKQSRRHLTDVTLKRRRPLRLGQGACVGDYDNDATTISSSATSARTFSITTTATALHRRLRKIRRRRNGKRWNSGCAFVDYDRDGNLDLFVANYIDMISPPRPCRIGPCLYKA